MRRNVSRRSVPTLPPDSFGHFIRTPIALHLHSDRTSSALRPHFIRTPFALGPHFDRTPPALHLHFADSFQDPDRTLPTLRARIATLLGHSIPSLGTPRGTSSAPVCTPPVLCGRTVTLSPHPSPHPSSAPPAAISRRVGSVIDRHAPALSVGTPESLPKQSWVLAKKRGGPSGYQEGTERGPRRVQKGSIRAGEGHPWGSRQAPRGSQRAPYRCPEGSRG